MKGIFIYSTPTYPFGPGWGGILKLAAIIVIVFGFVFGFAALVGG